MIDALTPAAGFTAAPPTLDDAPAIAAAIAARKSLIEPPNLPRGG